MLNRAVLPGSFNPLTKAHLEMAHYAESRGARVIFEISISNVDKADLTQEEKTKRLIQFEKLKREVIFTNRTSFVQKIELARYCGELYDKDLERSVTFLIGSDTLSRIQDKKYYFDSEKEMERCLTIIAKSGCDFCVFERNSRIEPHPIITDIVEYADIKTSNISSTQLRNSNYLEETYGPFGTEKNIEDVIFDSTILIDNDIGKLIDSPSVNGEGWVVVQKNEEFFNYPWGTKVRVKCR